MDLDDINDPQRDTLLPALAHLESAAERSKFLDAHVELIRTDVVEWLTEVVRQQARVDVQATLAIADFTVELARRLASPGALAQSLRAKANAQTLCESPRRS